MDKLGILSRLFDINCKDLSDFNGSVKQHLEDILPNERAVVDLPYNKIAHINDDSFFWEFLVVCTDLLQKLAQILENSPADDVLSVQQTQNLRTVFSNVAYIGISLNLIQQLSVFKDLQEYDANGVQNVLIRYRRLAATVFCLNRCVCCSKLRYSILPQCLKALLSGFYQIVYCPLKKPCAENESDQSFAMTEPIYKALLEERTYFKNEFEKLRNSVHKTFYVRETMLLVDSKSPTWFRKAVSCNLNEMLLSEDGLEHVSWAMFDSSADYELLDRAKTWRILDVVKRLILSANSVEVFHKRLCPQLKGLLHVKGNDGKPVAAFERVFVTCVKELYQKNETLFLAEFLPVFHEPLLPENWEQGRDLDVTNRIFQGVRLIYMSFVEDDVDSTTLMPISLLNDIASVLYYLFLMNFPLPCYETLNRELKSILVKYLMEASPRFGEVLDTFLFNFPCIKPLKSNVEVWAKNGCLMVKRLQHPLKLSTTSRMDCMKILVKDHAKLRFSVFLYCLNCLNDTDKYFGENPSLVQLEDQFVLSESVERKLGLYQLLSELSEDKDVQKRFSDDPKEVIDYFANVLNKTLETKSHVKSDVESEGYQAFFTVLMILQALVSSKASSLEKFQKLAPLLKQIAVETANVECKTLLNNVIKDIRMGTTMEDTKREEEEDKTEVDKAIDDICDPLLPIRGHGLMALAKLIEKKDEEALKRKIYILNIFQQNLKNEDSFIYLSAIGGLVAMGDIFPEVVLKNLTEEFSDFSRTDDDGNETRMKLGEVLVRVTKTLGETAPKFKSILLNTFLNGAKDEDHLIRASSLSNLGEVCRVLGYKLGTIVSEVLECVHGVLEADKSIEARRAAVTVIRQLLAGLDADMITFLRDELLEIYRTIKNIYYHDADDVMRLQAQLALEELNENVKKFLFPSSLSANKSFATLQ